MQRLAGRFLTIVRHCMYEHSNLQLAQAALIAIWYFVSSPRQVKGNDGALIDKPAKGTDKHIQSLSTY